MRKDRKGFDVLQLIDRKKFDELVAKWEFDKRVKDLKAWEFICALVTSMTFRLRSYREVERALNIPRSTFGDAMTNRCHGFFEELCDLVLMQIRAKTRDRKIKKAIRQILAIDSTECRVHGSLFSTPDWKPKWAKGRQAAAKLHVVWNIDGGWIDDYIVTGARRHDSPLGHQFELAADKTYVFDRAYNDLHFWLKIMDAGSHFVTRLKSISIRRLSENESEFKNKTHDGVLFDGPYKPSLGSIRMLQLPREQRMKTEFRYIVYRDPETKKIFYFVTSDFKSSAQSIADIYKKRWAVELLFRWLKGHLDIRYFEAKSTNAIKIQLSAAVITQLLLQLKKITDCYLGTLWELLSSIRTHLIRRSLSGGCAPDGCRWRAAPANKSTACTS